MSCVTSNLLHEANASADFMAGLGADRRGAEIEVWTESLPELRL